MPDISYGSPTIDGEIQIAAVTAFQVPGANQTIVQTGSTGQVVQNASDTLIRTNTASKTLYVTHISLYASGNFTLSIKDNGTIVYVLGSVTTGTVQPVVLNFPTPLKFSTNIQFRANAGTPTVYYGLVGWEE